jgi:hypothetical protein
MCQWFAPTSLNVTFETQGKGAFTPEVVEDLIVRDKKGEVEYLDLPSRFILTAKWVFGHHCLNFRF